MLMRIIPKSKQKIETHVECPEDERSFSILSNRMPNFLTKEVTVNYTLTLFVFWRKEGMYVKGVLVCSCCTAPLKMNLGSKKVSK